MRGRRLKPSFFTNPSLAKCHPLSRILYEGLWCHADQLGRFKWEPERLRVLILPYENFKAWKASLDVFLAELTVTGHIVPYPSPNGSGWFGYIPTALDHFPPDKRESGKSKCPDPPAKIPMEQRMRVFPEGTVRNRPFPFLSFELLAVSCELGAVNPQTPIGGVEESPIPECVPGKTKPYPELFEQVISDLNAVTGKNYKHTSSDTRTLITARWNQGFDLGDFRHVHRVKFADWGKDPSREQYLRPKTLYGTKFEGYRQQKMPHPMKGKVSDLTIKNLEATEGWENE